MNKTVTNSQKGNQQSIDDELLLAKVAQQDQVALSQLYDRYAHVIYALAFKSLGSIEESEEVVLDVFSQVWRTAHHYDSTKSQVGNWLFMMARSRVFDLLRKRQRLAKTDMAAIQTEIQSTKASVDPLEEVLISERRSQILAALDLLPKEQRQVIEFAYYQGLSHSEIAAQMGLSLGTIKTRIRLGLSKLRLILSDLERSKALNQASDNLDSQSKILTVHEQSNHHISHQN